MKKKAIVVHSGGMDSSLCLAVAIKDFSVNDILSMSFRYEQRHIPELDQAKKICADWNVDHVIIDISCLKELTENALTNHSIPLKHIKGEVPNSLVSGRNGLMARLSSIHANDIGADCIYMGVIELDEWNAGYRDCSRDYMDLKQQILRKDFDNPHFEIRTPLVKMTKKETMILGYELGVLEYLLRETISCYEGLRYRGCEECIACKLRNEGIKEFLLEYPHIKIPY